MSMECLPEVEELAHQLVTLCEAAPRTPADATLAAIATVEQRLHCLVGSLQRPSTGERPYYAIRLEELFDRHRRPDGRRWTILDVAAQTGCSPATIRALRHGHIRSPSRLAQIAAFFGEDVSTFYPTGSAETAPLPAYARHLRQLFHERRRPDGQPWTQSAIAAASGCSPAVLSRLLRGEQAHPKAETLLAIERAFEGASPPRLD